MSIELIHKEDWGISIKPGTTVQEIIETLQTLPQGLVVQSDYTRTSGLNIICFERAKDSVGD